MPETINRGDTKRWLITLVDSATTLPYNLASTKLWITYKLPTGTDLADDSDAIIKHYIDIDGAGFPATSRGLAIGGKLGNAVWTTASQGVLTETMLDADMTALGLLTVKWDMQILLPNGDVYTLLADTLGVSPDVTRRLVVP